MCLSETEQNVLAADGDRFFPLFFFAKFAVKNTSTLERKSARGGEKQEVVEEAISQASI